MATAKVTKRSKSVSAGKATGPPVLRFAILNRVSTKKQKEKGESLKTQSTSNADCVKWLGGTVVGTYGGQEHATVGHNHPEVERLLKDAEAGKCDAVIVSHPDRWSRDNAQSKAGLDILRRNGIKFFVGTQEYDLFNPTHSFFLGISAEIGELLAATQNLKSIEARIHRAKRGIPTSGKLPYGRTFDKVKAKTGDPKKCWGIDPVKHKVIKDAAKRYLAGESFASLAADFKFNVSYLALLFRERCGDTWTETFDEPRFKIHAEVVHKVPRLLDERTIKAIAKQAAKNRSYLNRGEYEDKYLLSGYIYCAHCGYKLSGNMNRKHTSDIAKGYYRHAKENKMPCPAVTTKKVGFVDLQRIENAVIQDLFGMFGDPAQVEAAIKRAIPNQGEVATLREEQGDLDKKRVSIKSKIAGIQDRLENGLYTEEEATASITKWRAKARDTDERLSVIASRLRNVPNRDRIRTLSAEVVEQLQAFANRKHRQKHKIGSIEYSVNGENRLSASLALALDHLDSPEHLDEMTWESKRALIEKIFKTVPSSDSREPGVYISWDQSVAKVRGKMQPCTYSIHGTLEPAPQTTKPKHAGKSRVSRDGQKIVSPLPSASPPIMRASSTHPNPTGPSISF